MNNELLENIGLKYNLRVAVLPSVTLVYSKVNEWMIEEFSDEVIILHHFDNPRKSFKVHQQMHFENRNDYYEQIFEYIQAHDFAVLHEKYKLGKMFVKIKKTCIC